MSAPVRTHQGPTAARIIRGEELVEYRVLTAPWAPSMGSWESTDRWGWTCPECGIHMTVAGCAVDLSCSGPEDWKHPTRTGLRPGRETSAPASLNRHLLGAGTVDRIVLLRGALELAHRTGAAEALEGLAAELVGRDEHHAGSPLHQLILDRAERHRTGEL